VAWWVELRGCSDEVRWLRGWVLALTWSVFWWKGSAYLRKNAPV
jgi:hypothetical protein